MNFKKFLLLLGISIGLGGYIYFVALPGDKVTQRKEKPFKDLELAQLHSIAIDPSDSSSFVLENRKGEATKSDIVDGVKGWRIKDLVDGEVEAAVFNALFEGLKGLSLDTFIPPEDVDGDLSAYGLDKPALALTVNGESGSSRLVFGKSNSYVKKRYLKFGENSGLYLIPESLFEAGKKRRDDFRDLTPIDFQDSDVKALELVKGEESIRFEKNGSDWRIVSPGNYTGDSIKISGLLRELRALKAEEFFAPATLKDEQSGLGTPYQTVRAEFKDRDGQAVAPLSVDFGVVGSGDKRFFIRASNRSTIFKIGGASFAAFDKPVDEFRSRELNRFITSSVSELEIKGEGRDAIKIARQGDKWMVNDGREGDAPFIEELIRNISFVKADSFPSESIDMGFSKPFAEIVVRIKDQGETDSKVVERRLVIGAESALVDGRFAAVGDLSEPFIVTKDDLKKLLPSLETVLRSERVDGDNKGAENSASASQAEPK